MVTFAADKTDDPAENLLGLTVLSTLMPSDAVELGDAFGTTKNCSHRCGC